MDRGETDAVWSQKNVVTIVKSARFLFFVVNYDVLWVGFEDRQRRVSGVIFLGIQVKLVKETVISMGEFWSGKQV